MTFIAKEFLKLALNNGVKEFKVGESLDDLPADLVTKLIKANLAVEGEAEVKQPAAEDNKSQNQSGAKNFKGKLSDKSLKLEDKEDKTTED